MDKETAIKLFEEQKVRVEWDENQEKWYFSIVDVVAVLTSSEYQTARNYWKLLKHRLSEEGNQTVTNCNQLKMIAPDGKMRLTDVADTEQLLRLIQSIPSPKAEPFKMWLAKVGRERIDEMEDPEITINRALETYLKKGYSEALVNQRLKYEPCVFCTSIFTFIKLNFLKQRFRVSQLPGSLALSLLMLRVLTNNADDTLSLNNLALFADRLY